MRVIMVVSSGFYEDMRVRKCATTIDRIPLVDRVHVLCMNRHGITGAEASFEPPPSVSIDQFPPHSDPWRDGTIRKLGLRIAFIVWALIRAIRLSGDRDTVHCHDLDTAIIGAIASRFGRRFVYDAHEIYPERSGVRGLRRLLFRLAERGILMSADSVVTVSCAAVDYYKTRTPSKRVVVVTNSRSESEIVEPALPTEGHALRAVYLGAFTKERCLEQMIEAVALTDSDIQLDLIGFGPLKPELDALAARQNVMGSSRGVRVLPAVPVTDVVATAASYDLGLVLTEPTCLNHRLSVSNKLFDYAAGGLPMLLSRVAEHERLVEEYRFGVITGRSAGEIARCLDELGSSPALLKQYADGSRRLARARCWEKEARGYCAAYRFGTGA